MLLLVEIDKENKEEMMMRFDNRYYRFCCCWRRRWFIWGCYVEWRDCCACKVVICYGTGSENKRLEMLFGCFLTGITCWVDEFEVLRWYFVKCGNGVLRKEEGELENIIMKVLFIIFFMRMMAYMLYALCFIEIWYVNE